jgi:hypothetical protein
MRAFVFALLVTTSCFAVTDLDRFKSSPGATGNFSDLRFHVRGMDPHVTEYFEYRVIDSTNTIQSRGIVYPLGATDDTLFVPGAIPKQNGPFHLDFWADHDRNGTYTEPSNGDFPDHSWRLPLPDPDDNGLVDILFDHNTSFNDIDLPSPAVAVGKLATIHLVNLEPIQNKRIEIRIADSSAGRVVALYRVPTVTQTAFDATIPGMIDDDVNYAIEVYTDDGNGGAVVTFEYDQSSGTGGLETTFDPGTAPRATGDGNAAPP